MAARWIVDRTQNARFPWRIAIEQDGRALLTVRAQSAWPGAGSQIFCLREREFDPTEALERVEDVAVAHLARLGRKLSVTLDRSVHKRCEFLKVEKPRADGAGTIEQIFFRTEAGVRAHRTSGRVELVPQTALAVAVDVRERYGWRFPGATVTKRRLPVGDYALLEEERIAAVVERKSLENFLANVHEIKALHQQMSELSSYAHAAMVVEAQYADLGRPSKIGRWPASHLLRVVAELAALHPSVPVVFAGNRKLGNAWTQRFFAAVGAARHQSLPDLLREPLMRFEPSPSDGGVETKARVAILETMPERFTVAQVHEACADVPERRIRLVLAQLRREGRVRCERRGPGALWAKTPPDAPHDAR